MHVGIAEIVIITLAAAVCLGPEKPPAYARKTGKRFALFKQQCSAIISDFDGSLDEIRDVQEILVHPADKEEKELPLKDRRLKQKKRNKGDDLFWNKERLSAHMQEADAVTAAYALKALSEYLGTDWL